MKISHVFAAATLAVAALGASSSAEAQRWGPGYDRGGPGHGRSYERGYDRGYGGGGWHHRPHYGRGYYGGGYGRGYGAYGRGYGWRGSHRGVRCWTEWRYRHRVRICG
jgi:hypothetical protein